MARGKAHSDEVKAQVMAALLAGQSVTEVAREYRLDKSIVSRWKHSINHEGLQVVATKKGDTIEELLYGYLTTILGTLQKQAEIAGRESYVLKQPADSLAVLHGVMADKGIRILEAAHRAKNGANNQ